MNCQIAKEATMDLALLVSKLSCLFRGHWRGDLYIPERPPEVPFMIQIGCYYRVVPGCLRCKKEFK